MGSILCFLEALILQPSDSLWVTWRVQVSLAWFLKILKKVHDPSEFDSAKADKVKQNSKAVLFAKIY